MEAAERKPPKLNKKGRWNPKKWSPLYDQMVALSCFGLSNKAIAERFDYTPQQVCNILGSDQAKVLKELASKHIRETALVESTNRLSKLEEVAINNIDSVLRNSELIQKFPIAMYDRSLAFLKGIGKMEGDKPTAPNQTINNITIADSLASKLVAGIEKSNEAALMHGNVEVRKLPNGPADSAGTEVSRKSA